MNKEKRYEFNYTIDTADWGFGCDGDSEKCEEALSEWFDNLTLKTKLAIYYSQKIYEQESGIDTWNECPWSKMIKDAEIRIKEKYAPYALKANGHNLFIHIHFVHEKSTDKTILT